MALPALRHPSPHPQPTLPLSTLVARDNNFRTGLGDPPHGHDPGAGAWGSKPKTAGMIAKKIAIVAAINQGVFDLYSGPNASRHMAHYLENMGMPLRVNLEDMIRSVPSAQLLMVMKFRQAQTFVQTLPFDRHQFTSINAESGYDYKTESAVFRDGRIYPVGEGGSHDYQKRICETLCYGVRVLFLRSL